jgi:hypothetical protein
MAGLRFADLQSRPTEFLDLTSVTLDEFQLLLPPFEAAFHAHMAAWRLDGKPRTARRFTVYQNRLRSRRRPSHLDDDRKTAGLAIEGIETRERPRHP